MNTIVEIAKLSLNSTQTQLNTEESLISSWYSHLATQDSSFWDYLKAISRLAKD